MRDFVISYKDIICGVISEGNIKLRTAGFLMSSDILIREFIYPTQDGRNMSLPQGYSATFTGGELAIA